MIQVFILLGAAAAMIVVDSLSRKVGIREGGGIFASMALFSTLILLWVEASKPPQVTTYRVFGSESPLTASLKLDPLSLYLSMIFCGIGLAASIYSIRYMELERETGLDRYYLLLLTLVAGMIGVTLANDFFTLYVFWELMAISSYSLVSFRKWSWEAVEAGFKYLLMSSIGSLMALLGIALLYGLTGSLGFDVLKAALASGRSPAAHLSLALIMIGFGVTAAIVPFHSWLPDAHPAAPTPISAVLSGVVIKTGVYAMLWSLFKVFTPQVYGFGWIIMGLGALTMTFANITAIMQSDIKRFLAYSSIANIGYIITGMGIAAHVAANYSGEFRIVALALAGSLLHILNHALGKGLSFLSAGCYIVRAGTREISSLGGIGLKMPATTTSLGIGLLNLAGIPPLSGFWSKLFIASAGLGILSDISLIAVTAVFILNSILAAGYYLWFLQRIVFKRGAGGYSSEINEAPASMLAPLIALAATSILITIMLNPVIDFIQSALGVLLG
ncbi:MAG: hypothetical protein NZ918_04595 [Aigarchaeota archaeon]|nr:hypothetical protein [Aigarchaeota archaeon]MDW8021231.1 proton-conducting transporter membrane subunit [Nitrososphaerota archaeon]